ncbi:hypothetical protein MTR_0412s0010, partial [Medicago truncatula]
LFCLTSIFNGDSTQFSWWKSKIYSYIIGIDDELWDVIKDGPVFEVEEEGLVTDRKKLTNIQKKIYKKPHRVRRVMVEALSHAEYMNIGDRSTAKSIFELLCSTYKENQQVKEAKANQLVH